MQPTTRFQDGLTNVVLQETDFVLHHPLAFNPTNGGFKADSEGGNSTIGRVRRRREFPATRWFLRLDERHAGQAKSLAALILIPATTGWQGIALQLRQAFLMRLPFRRGTQEAGGTGLLDHEEGFARVTLLLPAVIRLRVLGIWRAVDGAFGAIMKQRAVVGPASVRFAVSRVAKSSAVRAGSTSWGASA
jgi:hypothetical protein